MQTLTDIESRALRSVYCLADGHAYQDMHPAHTSIVSELSSIWLKSELLNIPDVEVNFKLAYADLISSESLKAHKNFKICPTASNAIDLVGALLDASVQATALIEPTFDNLALLLRRRKVSLLGLSERDLLTSIQAENLHSLASFNRCGAIFLVNPNNPTGMILTKADFLYICTLCREYKKKLIIDSSFRLFNRRHFDDYKILIDSDISFINIEDTGKAWPTQDMKASIIVYSEDNRELMELIYDELYLCISKFTLSVLTEFCKSTKAGGLQATLWDYVDRNRVYLRAAIKDTQLKIAQSARGSNLSVEWIDCSATGYTDLQLLDFLREKGVMILPGRNFFWNSSHVKKNQNYIRVSMLKKEAMFRQAIGIIARALPL